jgi:hypothetical protein
MNREECTTSTTGLVCIGRRKQHGKTRVALALALAFFVSSPHFALASVEQQCSSNSGEECRAQDDHLPNSQETTDSKDPTSSNPLQSWFKNVSEAITKDGLQFLQDKVFGQQLSMKVQAANDDELSSKQTAEGPFSHVWRKKTAGQLQQQAADKESKQHEKEADSFLGGVAALLNAESTTDAFLNLVTRSDDNDRSKRTWIDIMGLFSDNIKEIKEQIDRAFGDLAWNPMEHFRPIATFYMLRAEEERTDPVWKRRQHRFHPKLTDVQQLKEFHNALYLSELSYSHTVHDIQEGLKRFQNDTWALLYATTDSLPHEPAHFIAIRKTATPMQQQQQQKLVDRVKAFGSIHPWELGDGPELSQDDALEVALVVRGTKDVGDLISDLLFETVDYRDGHKAHGGILEAGRFLVNAHVERFRELLNLSGKKIMRLWCFGHR